MYDVLFKPIRIGKVEIKNRIVLSPMAVHFAGLRGEMTEQMLRYSTGPLTTS